MSGNAFPLRAKYADRVICTLFFDFDGANVPTITDQDGFDTTVYTHTGGTGVYGFALADTYAKAGCISAMIQIAAGSTQYLPIVAVNPTTRAVTLTALTEAGVATQVPAGSGVIVIYAGENNLPPA